VAAHNLLGQAEAEDPLCHASQAETPVET
jgi:hypothetical protein